MAVVQAIGAVAALAAWVVLIGGIRVFARLEDAQIPRPVRTVTLLPREQLFAEGIRALAIPVAIALFAAVAIPVLARTLSMSRAQTPDGLPYILVIFAVALVSGWAFARDAYEVPKLHWWWAVLLFTVTALLVAVAALAGVQVSRPRGLALTVAALALIWGGAFDLLAARGSRTPQFEGLLAVWG